MSNLKYKEKITDDLTDAYEIIKSVVIGVDKLAAFVIATMASVAITYIGQKYWLFRPEKQTSNTEA